MTKITLGDCKYLYLAETDKHTLLYDPDDTWVDEIKGKVALELIDTGNGIVFNQNEKNKLDYSELVELRYLLNQIK
jgi:hypothetical protein